MSGPEVGSTGYSAIPAAATSAAVPPAEPPSPAPVLIKTADTDQPIKDLLALKVNGVNLMPDQLPESAVTPLDQPIELPDPLALRKRPEPSAPRPNRTKASADDHGLDVSLPLDHAGNVTSAMRMDAEPGAMPVPGALVIGESQSGYASLGNVASTGIDVALDRSSSVAIVPGRAEGADQSAGVGNVQHQEHLAATRELTLFGHQAPDTTLKAEYTFDLAPTQIGKTQQDKTLAWFDQTAAVGVTTSPVQGVSLTAGTNIPLKPDETGALPNPTMRVSVTAANVTLGTRQNAETAHYDAQFRQTVAGVVTVLAAGSVDRDKQTEAIAVSGHLSVQLAL